MENKMIHIEAKNRTYPLVFNLNVMEEIQEHYGSMDKWADLTDGDEPKIKDLKFGLLAMMNEAIDIENEDKEVKEPFVTSKQIGRILTEAGLQNVIKKVQDVTTESIESGIEEPKNM